MPKERFFCKFITEHRVALQKDVFYRIFQYLLASKFYIIHAKIPPKYIEMDSKNKLR